MKLKHLAILAALMVAGQSWALTAYEKQHGCNSEGEGCAGGGGAGQGGGGGYESSQYVSAFIADGSLWEMFSDSQGGFVIETELTGGKKKVHITDKAAYLIKPPPANSQMKRSALVYGPLTPAMTAEQAKKKDEEAKAKKALAEAAAKKAAEDKAVAEAIQKAGGAGAYSAGLGGPVSAKPAGGGAIAGIQTVGMQPAAGMSAGPITARKKP